jgi:hypothetical protein
MSQQGGARFTVLVVTPKALHVTVCNTKPMARVLAAGYSLGVADTGDRKDQTFLYG